MHQITFNEWYERLKSPHYANNEQMNSAFMRSEPITRLQISSFKHRASEVKEMYNYKFKQYVPATI